MTVCKECGDKFPDILSKDNFYCPKCYRSRKIKNPKIYSCALGRYMR